MTADHQPNSDGTAVPGARLPLGLRVVRDVEPAAVVGGDDESTREMVRQAQRGDNDAFAGLVELYQDRVYRVVIAVLHCDRTTAEDLCQEVFLRVHKGLPGFDGSARIHAWVHTIATNVAITEYRRRRTQKRGRRTLSLDVPVAGSDDLYIDPAGNEQGPGERAYQNEFLVRVRAAVHELPEDFRDAVVLRDMEGLSYEEIATVLDLPPGTVRSRIHRGRLCLQVLLKGFMP